MKTYIVPMFLVMQAEDENDLFLNVTLVQCAARREGKFLYQDEYLQPKEISEDYEPHGIADCYDNEELIA